MNVFVLCTGRCGSVTFVKACKHITNYTASHESRISLFGPERLAYPPNHIEADNRLSWFLGRLDRNFGNSATYVHLTRRHQETARSYTSRWRTGIILGYRTTIVFDPSEVDRMAMCLDYCDTVDANIELFLKDKTRKMHFSLETAKDDFRAFWSLIGADGDLSAALREWETPYNQRGPSKPLPLRAVGKALRLARKFPSFVRRA